MKNKAFNFVGRLVLTMVMTATFVFGGLLAVANRSDGPAFRNEEPAPVTRRYRYKKGKHGARHHHHPVHTSISASGPTWIE